jgi:hypothetical protein
LAQLLLERLALSLLFDVNQGQILARAPIFAIVVSPSKLRAQFCSRAFSVKLRAGEKCSRARFLKLFAGTFRRCKVLARIVYKTVRRQVVKFAKCSRAFWVKQFKQSRRSARCASPQSLAHNRT